MSYSSRKPSEGVVEAFHRELYRAYEELRAAYLGFYRDMVYGEDDAERSVSRLDDCWDEHEGDQPEAD